MRNGIDMADNNAVTTITESRNLRALPLRPSEDRLFTGKAWEGKLDDIKMEFRYFKITSALEKDAILIYGRQEISWLVKSLPDPEESKLDTYRTLWEKLYSNFIPKRNKHYAKYMFIKTRPEICETTIGYATRLREKAHECDFGNNCNTRILEHFIQKCISKAWALQEFLTEAGQIEDFSVQVHDMKARGGSSQGALGARAPPLCPNTCS